MKYKVGAYIRVSTEEQAQVIEGSLDSQRHRLKSFIDIKNMQDGKWGKLVDTYADEGLSAKDTRRPAFQRMMKDIKGGKINLILVTDLSRLSRSILDFCVLLADLQKANAKFLSVKEQYDTSTAAGEMMIMNMINLAQFERKQTSERVSINFHARAIRGFRNGGMSVLGYDQDPTNPSRLIVNEVEAARVRRVFEIYLEECSLSRTATRLVEENIRPKERPNRDQRHITAGMWTLAAVQNILKNKAYIALLEVNAKNKSKEQEYLKSYERYQVVPASWEPIVDEGIFNSAQNGLAENLSKERSRLSSAKSRVYFLSGIIYCEDCGRPMTGSSGHGKNKVHRYYVHHAIRNEKTKCSVRSISADSLEQAVFEYLDKVLVTDGYFDALENRFGVALNRSKKDQSISAKEYELELNKIERQISAAIRVAAEMKSDVSLDQMLKTTLMNLKVEKDNVKKAASPHGNHC